MTLLKLFPVYSLGSVNLQKIFKSLGETPAAYVNRCAYPVQVQRLIEYLAAVSDVIPVYFREILVGYVFLGNLALLPKTVS